MEEFLVLFLVLFGKLILSNFCRSDMFFIISLSITVLVIEFLYLHTYIFLTLGLISTKQISFFLLAIFGNGFHASLAFGEFLIFISLVLTDSGNLFCPQRNLQAPLLQELGVRKRATIKAPKLFLLNISFDETSAVYINIYAVKTTVSYTIDSK